jgi:hypothetical protein
VVSGLRTCFVFRQCICVVGRARMHRFSHVLRGWGLAASTTRNKLIAGLITAGELWPTWSAVRPFRVASRYSRRVWLEALGLAHLSLAKRDRRRHRCVGTRGHGWGSHYRRRDGLEASGISAVTNGETGLNAPGVKWSYVGHPG